jgi:ABC-type transport system involved in cytochrome c biogenesis permease subunit
VWPKIGIRAIALANVGLVLLGAFYIQYAPSGLSILEGLTKAYPETRDFAHLPILFYGLTVINVAFLLALLLCTVLIWQLRPTGRWLCTAIFASEIVYWFCWFRVSEFVLLRWGGAAGESLVGSLATVDGLGNSGLAAQFDVWYPVVALVALNLLYPRLDRPTPLVETVST